MHPVYSKVERVALDKSGMDLLYPPREKTGVIVVESFPALGRLAALRFWSGYRTTRKELSLYPGQNARIFY